MKAEFIFTDESISIISEQSKLLLMENITTNLEALFDGNYKHYSKLLRLNENGMKLVMDEYLTIEQIVNDY